MRTDSGAVAGIESGPAVVFRAIPYAAPPVGPLRWKPPQPPRAWPGVRSATTPGPACLQTVYPGRPNGGGYSGPVSEDCLTLDVTAPKAASSTRRAPVVVWIYGGGNAYGASNLPSYDGRGFARDGVVVVAMNYRLGRLGFFAHPSLTREAKPGEPLANYGLMDQIAALRWVRRNIAAFGGDPANVTLFGESAGGEDTLALLTAPAARGLFQKAIVQSGLGWEPSPNLAEAEAKGARVASEAGLAGAGATAEALRSAPAERFIGGQVGVIIDGRLIRSSVARSFARGEQAPVPLIIGSNSNEASLMAAFAATPAGWLKHVPASVKTAYAGEASDDATLARLTFNDEVMGAPARWIARQASAKAPAWLYYFSYVPERQRGVRPGTNHASEIPFVFDSLEAVPGRSTLISPSERTEATLAHACWVAFAKVGRPDCAGGAWARYDANHDSLFEFGDPAGPRAAFRKAQLDAQEAAHADRLEAARAPENGGRR